MTLRRFAADGLADVTVVAVTYNNARDIDLFIASLRAETDDARVRLVIADNDSADGTADRVRVHHDVTLVETGGNLGYAGGINAALPHIGAADAVLVLNPDLIVERGAVATLLEARATDPLRGVIVPLIRSTDGRRSDSLWREPRVLRAFGDALLGPVWPARPAALTEYVRDAESYDNAHAVEWATGAALLIDRRIVDLLGPWDERFFLYSEETDYLRRVRDAGYSVWFEPRAVVVHEQGASGSSHALVALMAVNRVRYHRKHSPLTSPAYHAAVIAFEAIRSRRPEHRLALSYLVGARRWSALPHAVLPHAVLPHTVLPPHAASAPTRRESAAPTEPTEPRRPASVIIPAHNEAAVIDRTLRPLAASAATGELDVVVVCNGCTDDTAAVAARFSGVRVVGIDEASKAAALNHGDVIARGWPRIYLDADIEASVDSLAPVIDLLARGEIAAARPVFSVDTRRSQPLVRAYYRARHRMPSMSAAMWGAGVYGLSEAGHSRLGEFPTLTADDLHVDLIFSGDEKRVVDAPPVVVSAPRTTQGLLAILARSRRGAAQLDVDTGHSSARELLGTVRGPVSLWDAAVFATFSVAGRRRARRTSIRWERDESSRQ